MAIIYRLIFLFCSFLHGADFLLISGNNFPGMGMFAKANQIIGYLDLFETGQLTQITGLSVDLGLDGLYYDPSYGPNWWSYYFEPILVGEKENHQVKYSTKGQDLQASKQRGLMSRRRASQLVKKYIRIKPHIQEKIDAFASHFFLNRYVIGVHYRGTDKKSEAPRVSYKSVFKEINKRIPKGRDYSLFVATDEAEFLEEAKKCYPGRVVAIEGHRSNHSNPGVHFLNKHNYFLGEEALIDASLLSQCDLLIRTSSNLSLWSTYFNPDLPVVLLNRRRMKTAEAE